MSLLLIFAAATARLPIDWDDTLAFDVTHGFSPYGGIDAVASVVFRHGPSQDHEPEYVAGATVILSTEFDLTSPAEHEMNSAVVLSTRVLQVPTRSMVREAAMRIAIRNVGMRIVPAGQVQPPPLIIDVTASAVTLATLTESTMTQAEIAGATLVTPHITNESLE